MKVLSEKASGIAKDVRALRLYRDNIFNCSTHGNLYALVIPAEAGRESSGF